MLRRLDAVDPLVRAVEERGALPVAEAARVLLAAERGARSVGDLCALPPPVPATASVGRDVSGP